MPFCPRWFLFNALLGIEQGVHRTPRVATVLKPRIISEVSVRYRARSSRFFPAVMGQARPPSIDARRSISVVVLSCSVFRPPRRSPANQSPRINSEVSARYTRYRTRSSQFFLAVCTAGTPAVRRPFGLGRCVAVFHVPFSREEPPANRKSIPRSVSAIPAVHPLPYPIVPVLSGCVGAGTPAVRSWSLCWHVPFLRVLKHVLKGGAPRKSIPRSVSATLPDRPGSFPLCWGGHARRSVLVVVLLCAILKGGAPANQFRGQCPLPYPIVPVLSRCVGAGTPTVRSWSLCWHVPFSREEPRESFPRSVPAIPATVPDRPGSFPLCWGGHARRSVLVVVLPCSVLKGGAPPRINSEVSVRYRTGSSRFFPAVRCDVEVRLCALLRRFGVRFAPRRPLSCTTSFGRDECR